MVNCDKNSEFAKNKDYMCDFDTGNWIKKKICNEKNAKAQEKDANNENTHICNEKTGYWVKKDGKIGMKLLLDKQKELELMGGKKKKSLSPKKSLPKSLHKSSSPSIHKSPIKSKSKSPIKSKSKSPQQKLPVACESILPGYKIISIAGDGNCFYNSVGKAMGLPPFDVRKIMASVLSQDILNGINAAKGKNYTLEYYKKKLLKDGEWVPNEGIVLFPLAFPKIGLIIINPKCQVTCYDTFLEKKDKYIIVYFHHSHYDLITLNSQMMVSKKDLPQPLVNKIKECKGVQFSVPQPKEPKTDLTVVQGPMNLSKKAQLNIAINGNIIENKIYDAFSNLVDLYDYVFTDTYKGVYEVKNIDDKYPIFLKLAKKLLGTYYKGAELVDGKNKTPVVVGKKELNEYTTTKGGVEEVPKGKSKKNHLEIKFFKKIGGTVGGILEMIVDKYKIGDYVVDNDTLSFTTNSTDAFNIIEDLKKDLKEDIQSIALDGNPVYKNSVKDAKMEIKFFKKIDDYPDKVGQKLDAIIIDKYPVKDISIDNDTLSFTTNITNTVNIIEELKKNMTDEIQYITLSGKTVYKWTPQEYIKFEFVSSVPEPFIKMVKTTKNSYNIFGEMLNMYISSDDLNFGFIDSVKKDFSDCLKSIDFINKDKVTSLYTKKVTFEPPPPVPKVSTSLDIPQTIVDNLSPNAYLLYYITKNCPIDYKTVLHPTAKPCTYIVDAKHNVIKQDFIKKTDLQALNSIKNSLGDCLVQIYLYSFGKLVWIYEDSKSVQKEKVKTPPKPEEKKEQLYNVSVTSVYGANNVRMPMQKLLQTKFPNVKHIGTHQVNDTSLAKGYGYLYTFQILGVPDFVTPLTELNKVSKYKFKIGATEKVTGEAPQAPKEKAQPIQQVGETNKLSKVLDKLKIDKTAQLVLLIGCNMDDEQSILDIINKEKPYLKSYLKDTQVIDNKIYFAFQGGGSWVYNYVNAVSYKADSLGIKTYVRQYKPCKPNDPKATKINPKTGKPDYICNDETGNWIKIGGDTYKYMMSKQTMASPKAVTPMAVGDIPECVKFKFVYLPGDTWPLFYNKMVSQVALYTGYKVNDKKSTSDVDCTITVTNVNKNVVQFINSIKSHDFFKLRLDKVITVDKNGKETTVYSKPNPVDTDLILNIGIELGPSGEYVTTDVLNAIVDKFGYKLVSHDDYNGLEYYKVTNTDTWCKSFIYAVKQIFPNQLQVITLLKSSQPAKMLYTKGQVDTTMFETMTDYNKQDFLYKNFGKMTDVEKCEMLEKTKTSFKESLILKQTINKLSKEIIEVGDKLNKTCGVNLMYMDPKCMKLSFFKRFLQGERDTYFASFYDSIPNAFLYIRFVTRANISPYIYEAIFKKYPTPPFLYVPWGAMTESSFIAELNPFVQMNYLLLHKDEYKDAKWSDFLSKIQPKFHSTSLYNELLSVDPGIEETEAIQDCMKQYTKNQLIEMLVKKHGGTSKNYEGLSHQVLCDMLSKKKFKIIPPKFIASQTAIPMNTNLNAAYQKLFAKQIEYVNSLSGPTKFALKRYTHKYDWQINQLLVKGEAHSITHPNQNNYSKNEHAGKLEYGYENVLFKGVTDVQHHLDNAFRNVQPIDKELIVYRGVKSKYKPEYNKQYWSCSTTKSIAIGFGGGMASGQMFIITLPKGTHVLPLASISVYPHENEVLLSRNGDYIITKQEGNTLYMTFKENKELYKTVKPTPLYSEAIKGITVSLTAPKYIKDIVYGYMGKPPVNTGSWVYYKMNNFPYIVKTLPFIVTNKKFTAEYPGTEFKYIVNTNKGAHTLVVKDGHVYESEKIVKFKHATGAQLVKNSPYVSQPQGATVVTKPLKQKTAPQPTPTPVHIPTTVGGKQYSKVEFITVQKANNIKNKILTHLQKYFPEASIGSVSKNEDGTGYNYVFVVKKPPINYKDVVAQYNQATPGLAIKTLKKYKAT